MSDLFISYAREDEEAARSVAQRAKAKGYNVWWDRNLLPGDQFRAEIERQLRAAKRVVVIWSRNSINSPWVIDEAQLASDLKKLIPICIDESRPPLGFGSYNIHRISNWDKDFKRILDAMNPKTQQYTAIFVAQNVKTESQFDSLVSGLPKDTVLTTLDYMKSNGLLTWDAYGRASEEMATGFSRFFKKFVPRTSNAPRPAKPTAVVAQPRISPTDERGKPSSQQQQQQQQKATRITTGQPMPMRTANLVERLLAYCVDLLVSTMIGGILIAMIGGITALDYFLLFIGWLAYHWFTMVLVSPGRTLGYTFVRLIAVKLSTQRPPGAGDVLVFAFFRILPVSWLWYFLDKDHRMLQDISSGTVVRSR